MKEFTEFLIGKPEMGLDELAQLEAINNQREVYRCLKQTAKTGKLTDAGENG